MPDEEAHEPEGVRLAAQARRVAAEGLMAARGGGDLATTAREVMARLRALAEEQEHRALATGPRPACRPGCPHCCHGTRVDVLPPEAIVLAQALTGDGSDAPLARVRAAARAARGLSREDRHRQRLPCVLLDPDGGGRCSLHALRPLACRAMSSFDAAACAAALADPTRDRRLRKHRALHAAHSAVAAGARIALAAAGLDARVLELATALDLVCARPDASLRWARGERILAPAAVERVTGEPDPDDPLAAALARVLGRRTTPNQRKAARRARRGR